jgi:hypothetical protein
LPEIRWPGPPSRRELAEVLAEYGYARPSRELVDWAAKVEAAARVALADEDLVTQRGRETAWMRAQNAGRWLWPDDYDRVGYLGPELGEARQAIIADLMTRIAKENT